MKPYEKALIVMQDLFAKDYTFAMATVQGDTPSLRIVDTFFDHGSFYVVTHAGSQKVRELRENDKVSLCNDLHRFNGHGVNIGHPLLPENSAIREKLIKVFEPWYFAHNNEADQQMCYVKIDLKDGFFYKDGTGYKVDFLREMSEEFPFEFNIIT